MTGQWQEREREKKINENSSNYKLKELIQLRVIDSGERYGHTLHMQSKLNGVIWAPACSVPTHFILIIFMIFFSLYPPLTRFSVLSTDTFSTI